VKYAPTREGGREGGRDREREREREILYNAFGIFTLII